MADNYLEKKFEQMGGGRKVTVRKNYPSLDTLLHRNRSTRGFDRSHGPGLDTLEKIIAVNCLLPSAMNRQALRFRPVVMPEMDGIAGMVRLGGALPEEHLPKAGTEATACIAVCSAVPEDRYIDIDLGISLQSMALRAVELGLSCCIVCAFDRNAVAEVLKTETPPLALLMLGKGAERIFLKPVRAGESLKYYRKENVHYVPKLGPGDIIIGQKTAETSSPE